MKIRRHTGAPARRLLGFALVALSVVLLGCAGIHGAERPKLVVVVAVDGLSQSQLLRERHAYAPGGFKRFLDSGAWYSDAHYGHAITFTAPGYATILTGASPSTHGQVGNDWWDRERGERVYCVGDSGHRTLGERTAPNGGRSPRNLRVETVGDALRKATEMRSRVLSISIKDRGAILPGGKLGEAYFFSRATGRFVTTDYYRETYPPWWKQFHKKRPQNRWFGSSWEPLTPLIPSKGDLPRPEDAGLHRVPLGGMGTVFPHPLSRGLRRPGPRYYTALVHTPMADTYLLEFAQAAVRGEKLGKREGGSPDLLALGFSSLDYVNHGYGPESPESRDALLRLDRRIAELFEFLDAWVGPENAIVVLTSDHGFADSPEYAARRNDDTGRIDPYAMTGALDEHLAGKFEVSGLAQAFFSQTIYLDRKLMAAEELVPATVERESREFLSRYPGVQTVFSREQLESGAVPSNALGRRVARSWHTDVSGDLYVIQKPDWYLLKRPLQNVATHGSPHAYDTQVPLLWAGPRIRSGKQDRPAEVVDVAPTLAELLGVPAPSGSRGRVLREILE